MKIRTVPCLVLLATLSFALWPRTARAQELLLVLNKWSESLDAFDAETGKRRASLESLGPIPHEMVLAPDQHTLYVTKYGVKTYTDTASGGNSIGIVDLQRWAKVADVSLGDLRRPHGIELGRSGRLYVTVDFPPAVIVVDPAARKVAAVHPLDQKLPHMLAVTRDERTIYVANAGSGSLSVLHFDRSPSSSVPSQAQPQPRIQTIAIGGTPMGLALSADERLVFATNRDGNELVVLATQADAVIGRVNLPGAPARVALVPGTSLAVVTLIEAGDVALVDLATATVTSRLHVGERAEGLFVDPRGRFATVAVQAANKVVKIALPGGKPTLELATGTRPDPMLLVPAGVVLGGKR